MRARLRRLGSLIAGPGDAWLLCRMSAWAAVLPLLKRRLRLETLAKTMWSGRRRRSGADPDKIVAMSRLLVNRLSRPDERCYERSLLAYRFLSQQGADVRLIAAARKDGDAMTGHAWVTVGGAAVGESDAIDAFVPLAEYGRGGQLVEREP